MFKKIVPLLFAVLLSTLILTACGSSATSPTAAPGNNGSAQTDGDLDADGDGIPDSAEPLLGTDPNTADSDGDGQDDLADAKPMLADNPIQESSDTVAFALSGLQVENNVDANGADVADHLELKVTNTGQAELTHVDSYITITDQITGDVQGYYYTLPGFSVKPGETKTIHFDSTGQPGHYSVNPNSAFYRDQNGLTLGVMLHAAGFAPQSGTVDKDPGGLEGGVE